MNDREYLATVKEAVEGVIHHNRPTNINLSMKQKNTNMRYFLEALSKGITEQLKESE